jgi:hypothetical protein
VSIVLLRESKCREMLWLVFWDYEGVRGVTIEDFTRLIPAM